MSHGGMADFGLIQYTFNLYAICVLHGISNGFLINGS